MQRKTLGIVAAAALAAGSAFAGAVSAAPIGTSADLSAAAATLDPVAQTQFFFGGNNYCFYDGGWRGPGWYACDYGPWVPGMWWGGGPGWHGWQWHGHPMHGAHGGMHGGGPGGHGPGGMHGGGMHAGGMQGTGGMHGGGKGGGGGGGKGGGHGGGHH